MNKIFRNFVIVGILISGSLSLISCSNKKKIISTNLKSLEAASNDLEVSEITGDELSQINNSNIKKLKEFLSAYEIPFLSENDGVKETSISLDYEQIRDNNLNMSYLSGLNYNIGDDNRFTCEFNTSLEGVEKEVQLKDTLIAEFYESFIGDELPKEISSAWMDILKDIQADRNKTITLVDFYKDYMEISLKLTLDNVATLEIEIPEKVNITD